MCSEEKGVGGGGTRYTIDKQYIYEYMIKHDTNLATCCGKKYPIAKIPTFTLPKRKMKI